MRGMISGSGESLGATSVYQLWLMKVMQEEREREIETAIRVRRLLRPQDGVTEPAAPPSQSGDRKRSVAVRAPSTETRA
jgi:hypothetical protein